MEKVQIDIDRLAKLAALRLDNAERKDALADLRRIIAMIDFMQDVDTEGVAPLAHPLDAAMRLRADEVTEDVDRAGNQECAPNVRDGLYIVPRTVG